MRSVIPDIPYKSSVVRKIEYKFLSILTMLFIVVLIISELSVHLTIDFLQYKMPLSAITCPIIFAIADLIAEVYGYRAIKKIIWNGLICQFLFGLFFTILVNISFLNFSSNIVIFKIIFNDILKVNIVVLLAIPSATFLNAIIISKLKLMMKGKVYWIRTIISSNVSSLINPIIGYLFFYFDFKTGSNFLNTLILIFLYGCVFSVIISPILSLFARKLKKKEELDIYDYNVNYNPFKF